RERGWGGRMAARPPSRRRRTRRRSSRPATTSKGNVDELRRSDLQGPRRGTDSRCRAARGLRRRTGGLLERSRRRTCRWHRAGAQPGAEVARHLAVRVRRLGDPHRGGLDHQGDDRPPLRFRPLPLHEVGSHKHMTEKHTALDNVLGWLHEGYPEGVPPKDYFPLLALLNRSLSEEEVVKAAKAVLKGT